MSNAEPSIRLPNRILATCPQCLTTLRAPRGSVELSDFLARHTGHEPRSRRSADKSAVWYERDAMQRLQGELQNARDEISAQKAEIARLHAQAGHVGSARKATP